MRRVCGHVEGAQKTIHISDDEGEEDEDVDGDLVAVVIELMAKKATVEEEID
ncbi:hypothetical protein KI387_017141, partial [Taxus chinensis]